MIRFGLRGRAIVFSIALLGSVVASLCVSLGYLNYNSTIVRFQEETNLYLQSLSFNAEAPLLLNDMEGLHRLMKSVERHPGVLLAEILDAQGRSLESYTSDSRRAQYRVNIPVLINKFNSGSTSLASIEGSDLIAAAPIRQTSDFDGLAPDSEPPTSDAKSGVGHTIGYIVLVHDLDQIWATFKRDLWVSLSFAGLVTALGMASLVIGVRQLTRPIEDLVKTTADIAAGNIGCRASESASSEIGALAKSFNHMTDRLQSSYESVEKKVRERTEELVRANMAKSHFLANMSHEIRTPMTAILGFSDSLADDSISEQERPEVIQIIKRNGEHLLQLINDILDLTKIEANKLVVERTRVETGSILNEVVSIMRPRAKSKGLMLEIEQIGLLPKTIESDQVRLLQILVNLVSNAIKFTESGGVRIVVRLIEEECKRPSLRVDVIDTGIGMTPEQIENSFKAFTQADESMTRRFGGTGLGLTISQNLAHLLGGEITVVSEPGVSSTFSLTLATGPLDGVPTISTLLETEPVETDVSAVKGDSSHACKYKILLAEDGVDNQRLLGHILRRAGADVMIVENGKLALEAALEANVSGEPFDTILMDMQMPVMDGYTATRLLRSRGYMLPIIAITAHAMNGEKEKCLRAGCDFYVTKPVDRKQLITIVSEFAQRCKRRNWAEAVTESSVLKS
ncbi:MAG: ATP-binding protein [Planctomycetota bacterium]